MNVDSIMHWERLGTPAGSALLDARLQLHWAAQIPAAVGSSWVEPLPDWAHLSFTWLEKPGLAASQWTSTTPRFRAALRPRDLTLVLLGQDGQQVDAFPLAGRTLAQGMLWLRAAVVAYLGEEMDAELQPPAHELPSHPVAQGAEFTVDDAAPFEELARWYANAERSLQGLKKKATYASPVHLWPHHLDIAVLIKIDPMEAGEEARSIGVGMTPGDGSYAEPYWYVSPWPYPDAAALPALEGGGTWHTAGWTGAVLPGSALVATEDPAEQAGQVITFLHSAINGSSLLLEATSRPA